MDQNIWQQLLRLESRDLVKQWFKEIHGRELNTRRTKEINASSKQAREFFKNADGSDYSVRPLLTYYGVASLSRALILLLKFSGGEEGLNTGHGLETINWSSVMLGSSSNETSSLFDLKIRTCNGLFFDLLRETNNKLCIHRNSETVDWRLNYPIPKIGDEITFGEILERLPDLKQDYVILGFNTKYAQINDLSYNHEHGFKAKIRKDQFENFIESYRSNGYKIICKGKWCELSCEFENFNRNPPFFIHSYIKRIFSAIPGFFLAEPFKCKSRYSQIAVTFLVAYFLGMLTRYFPTHWTSLIQGSSGDAIWPTINKVQHLVEKTYPELVIELINDILKETK